MDRYRLAKEANLSPSDIDEYDASRDLSILTTIEMYVKLTESHWLNSFMGRMI